jgi:undecaprenyl-phosphate galactose phosphotransferase
MTIAATIEHARRGHSDLGRNQFWRRAAIISGLILSDALCFLLVGFALHKAGRPPALMLFPGASAAGTRNVVDLLGVLGVIFIFARYLVGDYSRRQLFWDSARSTTNALVITALIYCAAVVILAADSLLPALIGWTILIFLLPTARQAMRYLLGKAGLWHLPTALLGTSVAAQEVYPVLSNELALGLDVRWVVSENTDKPIPPGLHGLRAIFAAPDEIADALVAAGCRQVILVPDDQLHLGQTDLIDQLIGANIRVAIVPSLRRLPLFGLSSSFFFGKDLLLLQVRNNLARLPQRLLKRVLDLAGSICAIAFLWPLFLVFAALIWAEDRGPVFFVQSRVGRGGLDFPCWKFRTMRVDAEAQMARWAHENPDLLARYRESNFKLAADPRVTRIGKWLRRTSLDELPQIINILLGHMSMVGPRPLLRRELPDYGAVISLYQRVRPGITGLWQISGRSKTTFAERVSYDEWYIKNWTVWYDIVIMLQTVWVMLRRDGAF